MHPFTLARVRAEAAHDAGKPDRPHDQRPARRLATSSQVDLIEASGARGRVGP